MCNKVSVSSNLKGKKDQEPTGTGMGVDGCKRVRACMCVYVCVCVSKIHLDRYFWRVPRGPSLCSSLSLEKRKHGKASASVPHLAGTIDFLFFPMDENKSNKNIKNKYTLCSCRPFQLALGVWFHSLSQWACYCVVWYGMVGVKYVSGIHVRVLCSLGTSHPMVARFLRDRSSSMGSRPHIQHSVHDGAFLFFSSFSSDQSLHFGNIFSLCDWID